MIATELLCAAVLPFCLGGALAPVSGVAPTGEADTEDAESTAGCVTGACDPLCVDAERYAVMDEIVIDTMAERRLWQRRVSVRLPWEEAVRYCAELRLDGLHGWRLPSPVELSGIRYRPGGLFGGGSSRHYCIPSIDQAAFPETPADLFWTSRSDPDDTAWYVGFDDGRSHRDVRSEALWVRCTHDPLPR